jgi:hypothetical protein
MEKLDMKSGTATTTTPTCACPYAYKDVPHFIGMASGATLASFDITQIVRMGPNTTHKGVYNVIESH